MPSHSHHHDQPAAGSQVPLSPLRLAGQGALHHHHFRYVVTGEQSDELLPMIHNRDGRIAAGEHPLKSAFKHFTFQGGGYGRLHYVAYRCLDALRRESANNIFPAQHADDSFRLINYRKLFLGSGEQGFNGFTQGTVDAQRVKNASP